MNLQEIIVRWLTKYAEGCRARVPSAAPPTDTIRSATDNEPDGAYWALVNELEDNGPWGVSVELEDTGP